MPTIGSTEIKRDTGYCVSDVCKDLQTEFLYFRNIKVPRKRQENKKMSEMVYATLRINATRSNPSLNAT